MSRDLQRRLRILEASAQPGAAASEVWMVDGWTALTGPRRGSASVSAIFALPDNGRGDLTAKGMVQCSEPT